VSLFPDKPNAKNYKTRESSVVEFVKANFSQFDWVIDRAIQDGCSKRRPDAIVDLGYQVLIVEVDEHQHTDYDCSCENKRIMMLSEDVGHRPIVFLRFNPDNYKTPDKNITSCWGITEKGMCVIKKNKRAEWESRLDVLKQQIEYWSALENAIDKTVEIVHLFYDTI
jgi:hypothetical protein